jgi:hypothetical protein
LGQGQHDWKFWDLIEFGINLINQIKGLIGELRSFETYLNLELIELMKSGT